MDDAQPPTCTTKGSRRSAGGNGQSSGTTDRSSIGSAATSADGGVETFGTVVEAGMVPCWAQCGVTGVPGQGVKTESKTCRISGGSPPMFCDTCLRCIRAQRQLCGNADQRKALARVRATQPEKWKGMVSSMAHRP